VFSNAVVVFNILADFVRSLELVFIIGHFEFGLDRSKARFHECVVVTEERLAEILAEYRQAISAAQSAAADAATALTDATRQALIEANPDLAADLLKHFDAPGEPSTVSSELAPNEPIGDCKVLGIHQLQSPGCRLGKLAAQIAGEVSRTIAASRKPA
jgi:hypothetical protein